MLWSALTVLAGVHQSFVISQSLGESINNVMPSTHLDTFQQSQATFDGRGVPKRCHVDYYCDVCC